ncbi:probable AVT6-involved in amino acid efflux from the vacuole [Phialocephala subalpina]|uniref:Probable AVT6-involved in amino acid efflux from the vacuole n=1 Tax=Phialocephala subalpina TaxID=576137 RepID=A0A1L7XFW1_9HELO|nr:probable AVT6-involved in amino acid efflux from the vacuole [Phialocephala subalpina]
MASYSSIAAPSGYSSDASRGRRRRSSRAMKDQNFGGQASWISSNVNLVNTIIGAGTLAMPLAMSHMGITLGTFVILWSGLTAAFGLYLQTRCARYLERGTSSFFALSQLTYPNAAVIFDAAIAIKCFGVGVSYLIIIGDLMPGVVRGFNENADAIPFLVDRHFWVTVFMLVVIPLSFLRRLDSLKYTSVVALVSIGYLVILVVYHFVEGDTKADRGVIRVVKWGGLIPALQSFPVIVFAYTCHQNMFSILNEIKDNSHKRTTSVIAASIGSAASIYILVAVTGYLSFGNSVAGNIVGMYIPSVASTIGKAAIVILVMFSYPLQVHPCRASVDAVLKWRPNGLKSSRNSPNGSPARSVPLLTGIPAPIARNDTIGELRFAIITTGIIVLSYIAAMTVSSLDKVLAYVGSTGSTSISFILPGLFYYKISAPDSIHHQRLAKDENEDDSGEEDEGGLLGQAGLRSAAWRKTILRKLSLALAIYGLFVMVLCLGTNMFFAGGGGH